MLSNFFKAILLTFLVPLATTSYAQESLDEMEDAPKEFSNFQQEVFDNLGLIFEKNSNELSAIQEKLSENLDIIFDERSQELTSIQEEVFQNLDNIFETNSKELSVVQSELNNLSEQISEIRLELSENKASIVKDAIEASENIVASGIKKSAGSVLFRLDAIEEEIRNLTGIIEELQFYTKNIALDATNRIGDIEFRLTELEGGDLSLLGNSRIIGGNKETSNANAELAITEKSSYDTALELLNDDKFELAIIEFDKLINAFPNGPLTVAAHYSKGDAFFGMNSWVKAIDSYLESFKLEPTSKYAENAIKSSYDASLELLDQNEYQLALLKFDSLINISSDKNLLGSLYYSKGDVYTGIKNWKLALKNYLKSYELDSSGNSAAKALKASYQTALMSLNENNFELAIIQFDSLIDVIPNGPLLTAAHYSKGDAFRELEDWKSAGKSYLESFRLEPEGKHAAKALMNVGMSLGKMQKINEACNILSKVEIRFPRNQIVEEAQYEMQILGCS
jgi:TolA-binding protein/Skp family chaperone for outer membrane proteins